MEGFEFPVNSSTPCVFGSPSFLLLIWYVSSEGLCFQYSEPYSRVQSMQLWYSLSLVLVLYRDNFHTLIGILKAFLALLRWFLMSLPTLLSCLIVLLTGGRCFWLLENLLHSLWPVSWGVWNFQQHHFCLLLADLQAYLCCKHAATGSSVLHELTSLWDQC